jgi:NAD-dependent deacetylase
MFEKKKIVVFTGAGVSAESGIKTFRASDGLWEEYRVEDVATPGAWQKDKELVLRFYNERRKQVMSAKPNTAHIALAELQNHFDVQIITQNIDDLHERAGSKKVLHLHGEILKARSTANPALVLDLIGEELNIGDKCELGSQLRPHIVWFGEAVPNMELANIIAEKADIFIVVGTSLNVYPAAGITEFVSDNADKYLIDPNADKLNVPYGFKVIASNACDGVLALVNKLIK